MGKRFDTMLFPNGKSKCFTLSYDDGVVQDRKLVEIFNKYQIKGTFNLGYGILGFKSELPNHVDISKVEVDEVQELYNGHEVGGHGYWHSALNTVGTPLALGEIVDDKKELEKLISKPLKMFAYPFGFYNKDVKEMLRYAGYQGARTVNSTYSFDIPTDFLEWNPTCHHKDEKIFELVEEFFKKPPFVPSLFYVWGHGYEFDIDNNWNQIETLLEQVTKHKEEVWFATNGEIITYVNAYNRLEYSVDGSVIYNPSSVDVWIATSFNQFECLKAGEYTIIKDTVL